MVRIYLLMITVSTILGGCSDPSKRQLPTSIMECDNVIQVHVPLDTVYARYDPSVSGYVLAFPTSVSTSIDSISIVEFGCYFEDNGSWERKSSDGKGYFGTREFEKWYDCPNGILQLGKEYKDGFNWLWRTKKLSGKVQTVMLYFIGKDQNGKTHCGTRKLVGIEDIRPR